MKGQQWKRLRFGMVNNLFFFDWRLVLNLHCCFRVGVSDDDSDSSEDDSKSSDTSCKMEEGETEVLESKSQACDQESIETSETQTPVTPVEIPSASPSKSEIETQPLKEAVTEQATPVAPAATEPIAIPTPAEPTVFLPINLDDFDSSKSLEALGLNHLKHELQRLGLKCGGALPERASRLFSIKGLSPDQIDPSLLVKPPKKK